MPIINTNTFWNYIINESEAVIDRAKQILSREDKDYQTGKTDYSTYYQVINEFEIEFDKYTTLRFPAGLTDYLASKLMVQVEDKPRDFGKITKEDIYKKAYEIKAINEKYEIRDYQIDAVYSSLYRFGSLIHSTVGSGKTSIMCLLVELLKNKKVLITNGNNFILQQIYDRLISFGETDISWNKTEDPDYTKRIIIINTSSSDVRLNEQNQEYINFLKTVQLWCIDESSHFQSITNFEPIFYMDQDVLEHVVGYTATPFRNYKSPYSDPSDFTLIALLGEPAFKYEMANTIADKNIAQPYSYFIRYKNTPTRLPPNLADNYFMQYRSNIIYNKNRNAAGFAMIKFLNEYNIKTLVSLNNIKPGQKLLKRLAENDIKALFICGNETIYEYKPNKRGTIKLEERRGNVEDIKIALSKEYNIILATQVFDEGVDIEIFQAAILFSAGKSPIKILQVSGRASRKKAVNNVSFIIDFKDVGANRVFENQYKQRKELLEDSGVKNIEDVHKFMGIIKEIGYKS